MKRNVIIFILTLLISSCISFEKKDFEFTNEELRHFSSYKNGDTIYFLSNLGDIDTILIHEIVSERIETHGGFMAPKPANSKWIEIKHLPTDNWHGTSQDMTTGGKVEILYQSLFSITKYPTDKKTEYNISFRNFFSGFDTIIGDLHQDTLILNDLKMSNYFKVKSGYPERIVGAKDVEVVYWTDEQGLTAFITKDGETWTKKSCH